LLAKYNTVFKAVCHLQVYDNHMYVQAFKKGFETRTEAALMLVHDAVINSGRPLPNIDAVLFSWDFSGITDKGNHAIWTFNEPMNISEPKFLVPGECISQTRVDDASGADSR
jgi:hypothetical protein